MLIREIVCAREVPPEEFSYGRTLGIAESRAEFHRFRSEFRQFRGANWTPVFGKLVRIELRRREEQGVLPASDDLKFRGQSRAKL